MAMVPETRSALEVICNSTVSRLNLPLEAPSSPERKRKYDNKDDGVVTSTSSPSKDSSQRLSTSYSVLRSKLEERQKNSKDLLHPAIMQAELDQHKDLFSRLKVAYLEQETKVRFLRAILDDPPLQVDQAGITAQQQKNEDLKAGLKHKKAEIKTVEQELSSEIHRLADLQQKFQEKSKETLRMSKDLQEAKREIAQWEKDKEDESAELLSCEYKGQDNEYYRLHRSLLLLPKGELDKILKDKLNNDKNVKRDLEQYETLVSSDKIQLKQIETEMIKLNDTQRQLESYIGDDDSIVKQRGSRQHVGQYYETLVKIYSKLS